MRCASRLALFFAALISPGCLVLSLQPAYDNESIVSDEALVGSWSNTDDQTEATIERGEWRSYRITYKDRFATRSFQGNLTKIGTATFLDLTELRGVVSLWKPCCVPSYTYFVYVLPFAFSASSNAAMPAFTP